MTNLKQSTYTIHDVNLTIGADIHHHYNLNILKRYTHKIASNGYYDKKLPILEPLDWIKSDEGKQHICKVYPVTNNIIRLFGHHPLSVYTTSFYVWLGYLKHCIGDIDTAIKVELVTYNVA